MIPEDSRFENDPVEVLDDYALPDDWVLDSADHQADVARLTELLRAHEVAGRGWASASADDVLVEISPHGEQMRANAVLRDPDGVVQAWGSVHDRAAGRMMFVHIVARDLDEAVARRCSRILFRWAEAEAREVGRARGLAVQQIDTGAFADDERHRAWLAERGYRQVRTWWQMSREVTPEEVDLVPDPAAWTGDRGASFRLVRHSGSGMPDDSDLHAVHDVLEDAFTDHFNSHVETFDEFVWRLREDPGHRWDHWWVAEVGGQPVGALVATVSESGEGPDGSYVSYIGVRDSARGHGVGKGLLHTVIADAAARGHDRVGLEVDADSPTGADGLYLALGWKTEYVTESWHLDVPVG